MIPQVTKHLKLLPDKFTNLPAPKSSPLERFVKLTEDELRAQQGMRKSPDAREDFGMLLTASLEKLSGSRPLTAKQQVALKQAGVTQNLQSEWAPAAKKDLNNLRLK